MLGWLPLMGGRVPRRMVPSRLGEAVPSLPESSLRVGRFRLGMSLLAEAVSPEHERSGMMRAIRASLTAVALHIQDGSFFMVSEIEAKNAVCIKDRSGAVPGGLRVGCRCVRG